MSQMARMSQKRDTSMNWEQNNPILMSGEFGYDTIKKQIKIGDGTTPWNNLPFLTSSEQIQIEQNENNIVKTSINKLETNEYIIAIKGNNGIKQFKFSYDDGIQVRTGNLTGSNWEEWIGFIPKSEVYTKEEIDELLANIEIGGGGTTAEDGNEVEY